MINLYNLYVEWRKATETAGEEMDITGTVDCGEVSSREDFANYAGLTDISFEAMLDLEESYERNLI